MLKKFLIIAILAVVTINGDDIKCTLTNYDIPNEWIDMVDPCVRKTRLQVQVEINAAMTYLRMAAHFSQDHLNRPGFAKHFFAAASEEREHARKLIDYLQMRGKIDTVKDLIKMPKITPRTTVNWQDGVSALKDALILETRVTKSIRDLIKSCENNPKFNDYHIVDVLTSEFLEEQLKGERELAGKISTLGKLMDQHGALGEYLFDKTLLE